MYMFQIHKKTIDWGGRPLTLETGKVARQADGAVIVTYGESVVLCTVVAEKKAKPDVDFFPLTVNYQEKTYAAGKIPGGFFKREGRPSENETLTSRLIDRPIRPLFPAEFTNETQVTCMVISHDMDNNPDIISLVGASAALAISGVPFQGPLGAARVGYKDGQYILNPTYEEIRESALDLSVAGTAEGVLMVESEAKELSEEIMLGAVVFGFDHFQPVIRAIEEFAREVNKAQRETPVASPLKAETYTKLAASFEAELRAAYQETDKQTRSNLLSLAREKAMETFVTEEVSDKIVSSCFKQLEKDIVRGDILKTGKRIDGRDTKTVRTIISEVGAFPRVHGSAIFTRGETQALSFTTLGTAQDEQILDSLEGESRSRFMLHYNFPPYSVGETGRMGSPGRREIGHGKLAWRALNPIMPSKEEFPYTIRTVSEITESNGSSSMATVCGASLSLMDAGVPLPRPVAGIAMGLIQEGGQYAVLSDILGDEDYLGDMDFKVAGTDAGITALQMDIKVTSITKEIMKDALHQAKEGRLHILGEMRKAIDAPRDEVNENAPRMTSIFVPKSKIGEIIGPGGKVIREICERTGAKIDIEEDGKVTVSAANESAVQAAIQSIQNITVEPEVGAIYHGKVVKIVDFGAFVSVVGDKQGLVHISELAKERVPNVEAVVKEGQQVYVKLVGFEKGKMRLSMKVVDQTTGQPLDSAIAQES
ncbi:MAG: polyribonucleotide nucleotidyltransferase [Alphaproteobacteria bacterium]|nr:polyribonucleotide nucleotidyltransferase [Alphaproteobacteria bacterium]